MGGLLSRGWHIVKEEVPSAPQGVARSLRRVWAGGPDIAPVSPGRGSMGSGARLGPGHWDAVHSSATLRVFPPAWWLQDVEASLSAIPGGRGNKAWWADWALSGPARSVTAHGQNHLTGITPCSLCRWSGRKKEGPWGQGPRPSQQCPGLTASLSRPPSHSHTLRAEPWRPEGLVASLGGGGSMGTC